MAEKLARFAGSMAGEPFVQCSVGGFLSAGPRSGVRIEEVVFTRLKGLLTSRPSNQSASRQSPGPERSPW